MLTYPFLSTISDYMKFGHIDIFSIAFAILVCLTYFVLSYFSYILQIVDNFLIVKNSIFSKSIQVDIKNIESINLVKINTKPVSVSIKLKSGSEVIWYTKNRTQEMYSNVIENSSVLLQST